MMKFAKFCALGMSVGAVLSAAAAEGPWVEGPTSFPMITDGLSYWLDATRKDTIERFDLEGEGQTGAVLTWTSRYESPDYGRVVFSRFMPENPSTYYTFNETWFKKDVFGAYRDGVVTGMDYDLANLGRSSLYADQPTTNKAVFLAIKPLVATRHTRFWGQWASSGNYIGGLNVNRLQATYSSFVSGGWLFGNEALQIFPWQTDVTHAVYQLSVNTLYTLDAMCKAEDGVYMTTAIGDNQRSSASGEYDKYFAGAYGEVIVYGRELSHAERRYVENHLKRKWRVPSTPCTWIPGKSGAWSDPANWTDGRVPGATEEAVVTNAVVTVTDDAEVRNVHFSDVTLSVAAGKTFRSSYLMSACGTVAFSVGKAATLDVADFCRIDNPSVSFVLDEATLALAPPALGNCSLKSDWSQRFSPPGFEYQETVELPGVISGAGTLSKRGSGTLRLTAADVLPTALELAVRSGAVDLNGTSRTFASVTGPGWICNSAEEAVTLTVESSADAEIEPLVRGENITVVKSGNGAARVSGPLEVSSFELAAGSAQLATNTSPDSIPGMTVHIDATRRDTFVLDADNRVIRCLNLASSAGDFTVPTYDQPALTGPLYVADGLNGKPGFKFAVPAGSTGYGVTKNALSTEFFCTNQTVFIVLWQYATQQTPSDAYCNIYGGVDGSNNHLSHTAITYDFRLFNGTVPTQGWDTSGGGKMCFDGRVHVDFDSGLDATRVTNAIERVTVMTRVLPAAVLLRPTIGNTPYGSKAADYYKRTFAGVIGEVIAYERKLTAEEIDRVNAYLMAKWGVTPDAVTVRAKQPLPQDGTVTLGAGTALDLGGFSNAVAKVVSEGSSEVSNGTLAPAALEVKVAADGTFGTIGGDADWAIEGLSLLFDGAPGVGKAVSTKGTVSGTPSVVQPPKYENRLRVNAHSIGIPGGLLLFVR